MPCRANSESACERGRHQRLAHDADRDRVDRLVAAPVRPWDDDGGEAAVDQSLVDAGVELARPVGLGRVRLDRERERPGLLAERLVREGKLERVHGSGEYGRRRVAAASERSLARTRRTFDRTASEKSQSSVQECGEAHKVHRKSVLSCQQDAASAPDEDPGAGLAPDAGLEGDETDEGAIVVAASLGQRGRDCRPCPVDGVQGDLPGHLCKMVVVRCIALFLQGNERRRQPGEPAVRAKATDDLAEVQRRRTARDPLANLFDRGVRDVSGEPVALARRGVRKSLVPQSTRPGSGRRRSTRWTSCGAGRRSAADLAPLLHLPVRRQAAPVRRA